MYKAVLGLMLLISALPAKDILPLFRLHSVGFVSDFVVDQNRLYAANDRGTVDIFDLRTQKIVDRIVLEPIMTGQGELIPVRVNSVDRLNGKTLLVSSGKNAFRDVWIHEKYTLKKIIDSKQELFIKKARFINDDRILFGTFASEMILYDNTERYQVYNSHVTQSTLGDIVLSADKKKMAMSDESGEIRIIDVESSRVEQVFSSENVDNVYRVAYNNGVIITAGQDRRVGVYQIGGESYHLKSDFLVYCVALSPDGKTGIYSSGENHDLQLFDTRTGKKGDRLIGHNAIVNKITFINEHELISVGDEKDIFLWRLGYD